MSHGSPVTKYKCVPRWSATFDIGVEEIDTAHRRLFAMADEIRHAMERGDRSTLRQRIDALLAAAEKHFYEEEQFLARVCYSETENHKAHHAVLLNEARGLKEVCDDEISEDSAIERCYVEVLAFLVDEIVRNDNKFKAYLDHLGLTR